MMEEYAVVVYTLLDEITLIKIEEHLAGLDPRQRAIGESRYASLGYNVGNDTDDTQNIKKILGA